MLIAHRAVQLLVAGLVQRVVELVRGDDHVEERTAANRDLLLPVTPLSISHAQLEGRQLLVVFRNEANRLG